MWGASIHHISTCPRRDLTMKYMCAGKTTSNTGPREGRCSLVFCHKYLEPKLPLKIKIGLEAELALATSPTVGNTDGGGRVVSSQRMGPPGRLRTEWIWGPAEKCHQPWRAVGGDASWACQPHDTARMVLGEAGTLGTLEHGLDWSDHPLALTLVKSLNFSEPSFSHL